MDIKVILAIILLIISYYIIKYLLNKWKIYINIRNSRARSKKKLELRKKPQVKVSKEKDIEDHFMNTKYTEKMISLTDELIQTFTSYPQENQTKEEFYNLFNSLNKKHRLRPKQNQILGIINLYPKYQIYDLKQIKYFLVTKAARGLSGVDVITIVLKPDKFSCTEKCSFCPTEYNAKTGELSQPKSYISSEPAMMRASEFNFTIIGQIWSRYLTYVVNGTIISGAKFEAILSGGTWESYPLDYRNQVMLLIYYSANTISDDKSIIEKTLLDLKTNKNIDEIDYLTINFRAPWSLEEEQRYNTEKSKHKIIGLTIETRSDYITKKAIKDYNKWGVTRVQLGIQSTNDMVLVMNKRGHTLADAIYAIRILKINGFKIVIHVMPDLYGSTPEIDLSMFKELITNSDLQVNDIKIYPCAVCKTHDSENYRLESEILTLYEEGKYKPYSESPEGLEILIKILIYYKKNIPPWWRIQRLVRDIPTKSFEAGYNHCVNLRQYIEKLVKCNCIRCHEIKDNKINPNYIYPVVYKFQASRTTEYFISFQYHEQNWWFKLYYMIFLIRRFLGGFFGNLFKKMPTATQYFGGCKKSYKYIIGFCRLRMPTKGAEYDDSLIFNVLKNSALVIELHVYSMTQGVNESNTYLDIATQQHKGYGQKLIKIAEDISRQNGLNKIAIISGVGVRDYYKNKCGYRLDSGYMIKDI